MIEVSDTCRQILAGSFTYHVSVQSWLGDQLLADAVPVSDGDEETDRSLRVPERVTLTVPARDRGVEWTPVDQSSPLAACGQTLKISLGVGTGAGGIEWFQRGEFLIQETELAADGQTLTVTAVGLLALINEATFMGPFQPSGTMTATVRSMLEPAVTVDLTDAPLDRSVVNAVNFDSDRLGGFLKLLDAWPATYRMHELGYLRIVDDTPPVAGDVVRAFTDDPDAGTVITAAGTSTRDGAFSAVVATGYATDGTEVRGIAYVPTGPWAYPSGAANPLPVPFLFAHAALATQQYARAAAQVILRRKMRESALRAYQVTAVPDPTLQVGDVVTLTADEAGLDTELCTVESIQLPYLPTGPMRVKVVTVV